MSCGGNRTNHRVSSPEPPDHGMQKLNERVPFRHCIVDSFPFFPVSEKTAWGQAAGQQWLHFDLAAHDCVADDATKSWGRTRTVQARPSLSFSCRAGRRRKDSESMASEKLPPAFRSCQCSQFSPASLPVPSNRSPLSLSDRKDSWCHQKKLAV